MSAPRVLVDFNSADVKGRLHLDCRGTLRDLARQNIQLTDGLVLTLYQDDADEEGRPQQLAVEGTVEYSPEEKCWVAVIDWDAIRHESEVQAEAANGKNGSPPTPAATPRVTP
jgi:hypothetical protein